MLRIFFHIGIYSTEFLYRCPNVNYFVRLASIMMAAFSVSLFHCFVASVDNYLLPVLMMVA